MWNTRDVVLSAVLFLLLPAIGRAQLRAVPFVTGLDVPVEFVQDPSNASVQYVAEQRGLIRVISNGVLQATPFLDLTALVSLGGERGLLGLAFPPDYAATGRFYVNYTGRPNGDIFVARVKRSAGNPLVADPLTRFPLVWPTGLPFIEHSDFANHNGGHLAFGPDGFLYIATGDGGDGDDPFNNAQNPNVLLGKILRVDVSVPDGNVRGYAVPPDNPFVDGSPVAALTEIWAFGMRNPWKFSFDDGPGGTGALLIADVGQGSWEEIDYEPANQGGRNYGWRIREGAHDRITSLPPAYLPLIDPVFEYDHSVGSSITGGFVYRGSRMTARFAGRYFYADFVRGRVWSLGLTINGSTGQATAADVIEHTAELGALGAISSFGRDAQGEVYIVSYAGTVFKIVDVTPGNVETVFFDYDGDAYKDVLLYNRATGAWAIKQGTALGTFTDGPTGGWATGWEIRVADFNADGFDDLFLYAPTTGVWFKVINNGGAGFTYFSQSWLPGLRVFIVELNGDGRSDVFLSNPATGVWFTCISTGIGTGGFTYGAGGWATGWQIFPGDFDADGRTDFLLYDPVSGTFFKAITRGTGLFSYSSGGWAPGWSPTVADFDGDTRADVLLYGVATGVWYVGTSIGDGTGGFSYRAGGWLPGWRVQVADFNADLRADLFLYGPTSGFWYKVLNSGTAFSYFGGGWSLWTTTVVDLNGDGMSDVFLYDSTSSEWYQALTTTPGAFTYTTGAFPR